MRKTRWLLILLLAAPLAGAFQTYQAPAEGVELKLENYTREEYLLAHIYAGAEACNKGQSVGEVTRSLVTTVAPGQVTTISLRGARADISDPNACSVYFSFRPEAGYAYRASLQLHDGYCRLGFNKVELATNEATAADRVLRAYRDPIVPTRGVCRKFNAEQRTKLGL